MNERLQLILACIRVGRANVLTTRDIAKMTNLSVRKGSRWHRRTST